jgi:hypothetical protein
MTNREIVAVYSENQRKTIISFLGNTQRERELLDAKVDGA